MIAGWNKDFVSVLSPGNLLVEVTELPAIVHLQERNRVKADCFSLDLLSALDSLTSLYLSSSTLSLHQIKDICSVLYGPIRAVDRDANGDVLVSI